MWCVNVLVVWYNLMYFVCVCVCVCSQSPNQALLEENRQFQSQVARHLEEINSLNLKNGVSYFL